jgi:hypothetical protein
MAGNDLVMNIGITGAALAFASERWDEFVKSIDGANTGDPDSLGALTDSEKAEMRATMDTLMAKAVIMASMDDQTLARYCRSAWSPAL